MLERNIICNCSQCGNIFNYEDIKVKYSSHCGVTIPYKVCPKCESQQWENINDYKFLDRYLNFADNGYRNDLIIKVDEIKKQRRK